MYCRKCGKILSEGQKFCPDCGERVDGVASVRQPAIKICRHCGCKMDERQQYCPHCGIPANEEYPVVDLNFDEDLKDAGKGLFRGLAMTAVVCIMILLGAIFISSICTSAIMFYKYVTDSVLTLPYFMTWTTSDGTVAGSQLLVGGFVCLGTMVTSAILTSVCGRGLRTI